MYYENLFCESHAVQLKNKMTFKAKRIYLSIYHRIIMRKAKPKIKSTKTKVKSMKTKDKMPKKKDSKVKKLIKRQKLKHKRQNTKVEIRKA